MTDLLRECVRLILERQNDVVYQRSAANSYVAVKGMLKELSEDASLLGSYVGKDASGRYAWINLGHALPRPEHEGLYLFFVDRAHAGVKPTLTALAQRFGSLPTREYRITVYVDSAARSAKAWNKEFAANVAGWFSDAREHYVHELVHVMDFRRMSDEFLTKRTDAKRQAREKGQAKDFARYVNDPLEANAFTHESFAALTAKLKRVRSIEEFERLMGRDAREFVDEFMAKHLDKRAQKHWTERNKRRVMTRAMHFYQRARERVEQRLSVG